MLLPDTPVRGEDQSSPPWARTRTLLNQNQTCCQLHQRGIAGITQCLYRERDSNPRIASL